MTSSWSVYDILFGRDKCAVCEQRHNRDFRPYPDGGFWLYVCEPCCADFKIHALEDLDDTFFRTRFHILEIVSRRSIN